MTQVAAARAGQTAMLKFLYEKYNIRLDSANRMLDSPVEEAARQVPNLSLLRFNLRSFVQSNARSSFVFMDCMRSIAL